MTELEVDVGGWRRLSGRRAFLPLTLAVAVLLTLAGALSAQAPFPRGVDPPTIQFSYPSDGARLQRENVPLLALATDESGMWRVQVTLNGEPVRTVTSSSAPPAPLLEIEMSVPLRTGENVIVITATNRAGHSTQVIRKVSRVTAVVGPARARPPGPAGQRYAVVIGVSTHDHPQFPAIRNAEHVARAVFLALTDRGGYKKDNVLLITESAPQRPTLSSIRRALGEWLHRKAGGDDTVFVYYAGHAAPGPDPGRTARYLIPRDADPESLFVTAFEIDDLAALVHRLRSGRVVLVLDTCARAVASRPASAPPASAHVTRGFIERVADSRGRVVISAANLIPQCVDGPGTSPDPFTHYLLRGMDGAADANRDRIVTAGELREYVRRMVGARTTDGSAATPTPAMSGAADFPILELED